MMIGFRNLSKQRDQDSGIDNYKHLDFMPAHSKDMNLSSICTLLFFVFSAFCQITLASDADTKLEKLKALQEAMNQAHQNENLGEAKRLANEIKRAVAELDNFRSKQSSAENGSGLQILKATYSAHSGPCKQCSAPKDRGNPGAVDVTDKIAKMVKNGTLKVSIHSDVLGGDPASGHLKILIVEYSLDGVHKTATAPENGMLVIPDNSVTEAETDPTVNPVESVSNTSVVESIEAKPTVEQSCKYENEVERLLKLRTSEQVQAMAPIQKRFDIAAQQLLRKMAQTGDLESAVKLKALIENPENLADFLKDAKIPQDKDIIKLIDQREKESKSAFSPIQKRFDGAVQQIIRKATQAGDFEIALRLKSMLEQTEGASASVQPSTNAIDTPLRKTAPEKPLAVSEGMSRKVSITTELARNESGPKMIRIDGGKLPKTSLMAGKGVKSFEIGKYEVTWSEWKNVQEWAIKNGYDLEDIGSGLSENHPVTGVNWYDVLKWCNAKSEMQRLSPVYYANGNIYKSGAFGKEGVKTIKLKDGANGYRLPTTPEWEWAARGGNKSKGYKYSGSNEIDEVGWYNQNSGGTPHPVGEKQPNELGLYDMTGNVFDWCMSIQDDTIQDCFRGGSWRYINEGSAVHRPDYNGQTEQRNGDIGFRIARSALF